MTAQAYLLHDTSGAVFGTGFTPDGTLPDNAIAGTAAQVAAWQGSTVVNDAIIAPPAPAAPTLAQQAAGLIASGLTIASTGTPALDGTYACDSATTDHIQAEMVAILVTAAFADGTASVAWPDVTGALHTFQSVAAFKAFAVAVAGFVAAGFKVMNGSSTTLPTATATIA
jgi:hypothetical protein